ncbi:MAG: ThiF family adenylyltransferase [Thermoleophilaceae bacterium]
MASGAELIRRAKEQITEVDPKEVHDLPDDRNGTVVVDVREQQEFEQSHIPGAKHVPRGHLESRIEGAAKADSHVILYCASGNRSALAAKTLQEELGYEDVSSMTGGITLWKDRGYDVEVPRALTAEQRERYSRHLLVPEIGIEGQLKLLDAKVLLLGAGGLGAPTALYLAAAGVGTIGIVDDDVVDLSNLQRQVIHTNDRIGEPKVDSAQTAINDINPDVDVVKHQTRLDASNIMEIIEGYDIIVDGVDNFPTRYLLNDASVRLQIPVVSASILGFDGQLAVFAPTTARATAACTPRLHPPSSRPPAAPTACSARCPGSWACCRPSRS